MSKLTTIPDPDYAQKALAEVREQQRLVVEKAKLTGLTVSSKMMEWVSNVIDGKERITEYTMKGEPYQVDGRKYLFENADKMKATAAFMETLGGKQEQRNEIHLAILGRGKEAPRKLSKDEVREIEVVEEIIEE